jgi:hypothetical protein
MQKSEHCSKPSGAGQARRHVDAEPVTQRGARIDDEVRRPAEFE